MKRVLLVAFHYPPTRGSSGLQRTLKFSRYLGEHGWEPLVLTIHPRAYETTDDGQLHEIPEGTVVHRAFALDAARHLSIGGRYLGLTALPDRWSSWWLGAVPAGLRMIARYRPDVIWSTYPIATANLIGLSLAARSGLPWVVDLRDSMTEDDYPPDPRVRRVYRWIERKAVQRAQRVVFTAPGTRSMYRSRYPEVPDDHWALIPNGYDEDNFTGLVPSQAPGDGRTVLLHSGILYPSERDPRPFFDALARLKQRGRISSKTLRVVLRATGHDDVFVPMIEQHAVDDIVMLAPSLPYADALQEMISAHGLLIFQAANCNHQVPAKLFEYMRAGRPVLTLTDPDGDTARLVRENGMGLVARLDSSDAIAAALDTFIQALRDGSAPVASPDRVASFSRYAQTGALAQLLDGVVQLRS